MVRRLVVALPLGVVAALVLVRAMAALVDGSEGRLAETSSLRLVEFVRLERMPIVEPLRPKPPPRPEPPTAAPPPMALDVAAPTPPERPLFDMPRVELDLPLNLGAGPLLSAVDFGRRPDAVTVDDECIPLVRLAPEYPYRARRDGIEGWVDLSFVVTADGRVRNVRVVGSHPRGVFDEAARQSLSRWRFKPKMVDGVTVERTAVQRLTFQLDS